MNEEVWLESSKCAVFSIYFWFLVMSRYRYVILESELLQQIKLLLENIKICLKSLYYSLHAVKQARLHQKS